MKNLQQKQHAPLRIDQYTSSFLKAVVTSKQDRKSLRIDPELHETLKRIVFYLGDRKISITAYIHNVLKHHLENFEGEIATICKAKNESIL